MDIGTIAGLILGCFAIVGSILLGGDLSSFWDMPSIFAVIGGVCAALLIKWPMEQLQSIMKVTLKAVFFTAVDPKATIEQIGQLADTARRESVFALEKVQIDDTFLKKAMTLAADNRPPEVINAILQMEIDAMGDRHKNGIDMWDGITADGPAFGMIGTLIGLVSMLKNLSDPSAIGPAMAVALITTFYGSVIANLFAGPIKQKLTQRSKLEMMKMSIIVMGTLGIVAGENPRLIKEKLSAFLPPVLRDKEETEDN